MKNKDQCIVTACEQSWDESFIKGVLNKNNCSGFVKSVAARLNVHLPSTQADGIVEHIAASQLWIKLDSGASAAAKAQAGHFVLVGLKAKDHTPARTLGHVAVVVSGPLYRNQYPKTWGGSIGVAQSKGTKSSGEIWNRRDRDNVGYYMYSEAVCK